MNPENKAFFNHEEETSENKAENKEKKEFVNLSFVSAADLVKQIKEKRSYFTNEYQKFCEYAVINNKTTNQYDTWYLEEDGYLEFLEELPEYYRKANDKDLKVFFCGTQYDIPLNKTPKDYYANNDEQSRKPVTYLTPDGIKYDKDYSKLTDENGEEYETPVIKYFDSEQLSLDEVKKQAENVKKQLGGILRPFRPYHYGQSGIEEDYN